jgi:hypothetical protein
MDADRQGEAQRCTSDSSQCKLGKTLDVPCNTILGATVLHYAIIINHLNTQSYTNTLQ